MPTAWDSELDRKLLLVALDPENKPDWGTVATRMGNGLTGEGVRQRFAKLKKEATALGNPDSSTTSDAPKVATPKTPRKRKAATDSASNTPKKARTPRKKNGAQDDKAANGNGEELNAKTEGGDGLKDVKTEVSQEDNDAEPTAAKSEGKEDA